MKNNVSDKVFDYRALRLLVGLIAFALPFVVSFLSSIPLSSISASYYTEGRFVFVGMLSIVGAFLWAYNGHTPPQKRASKVASLAAICVAFFPTTCDQCDINVISVIHYVAAATLFIILAYFCFGPFRLKAKNQTGKKGLRSKIYLVCGWIMVGCMLTMLVAKLFPYEIIKRLSVTYWAEAIALCAFGFAWIVAGKYFRIFVDKKDALIFF
jgi:hypothetical protein